MKKSMPYNEDFPAAHSMDTMWFAVDKDGCVAAFESQEGGVVPETALSEEEFDVLRTVAQSADESNVIYARDDRRNPLNQKYLHSQPRRKWGPPAPRPSLLGRIYAKLRKQPGRTSATSTPEERDEYHLHTPLIMFVDKREDIEPLLTQLKCQIVQATEGIAVIFQELPIDIHKSLHDRNLCRACVEIYSDCEEEPYRENPSLIGLYFYSCCESQAAYPYGRVTLPERPLRLNQFPQQLREKLMTVRFADISFAEASYIQPAERVKSFSWDGGYLSEDWKHYRVNPGQEEQYKNLYESIKEYGEDDGIEFAPP